METIKIICEQTNEVANIKANEISDFINDIINNQDCGCGVSFYVNENYFTISLNEEGEEQFTINNKEISKEELILKIRNLDK